jgi:valyl-tRNA synthetase
MVTISFKNANILVEEKKYSWQKIKDAAVAFSTNCCKISRAIIDNNDILESEIQDEDTLDTWFSSGLWTFSTLAKNPEQIKIEDGKLIIDSEDFKNFHPTSVLETGYDILFFWVARMIIMTTYAIGDIPFQNVYLHGLVLDEKGKKMSKSKGNVINPLDMIAKYGADATRLSLVVGSTPGNDIKLSEEKIAGQRNFVNKLWNVARYILGDSKLEIRNLELEISEKKLTGADAWILNHCQGLIAGVRADIDNFAFSAAGEKLIDFVWNDLADWYLEASKFEESENKKAILIYILRTVLKLLHPFAPFITEVIWGKFNNSMLIVEKYPSLIDPSPPKADRDDKKGGFELARNIILSIRNARAENKVEPAKKIEAVIYAGENAKLIRENEILIKSLRTGISDLKISAKGKKVPDAIYAAVGEIEIYLLGAVDAAKEKARLEKEIANLEKFVASLNGKLSNQEFVGKAPEKVVATEKEKLAKAKTELKKLKEQLKNL